MTERQLLALFYNFIVTKQIIQAEDDSIKDMVVRYKFPPFTVVYPCAMRMTTQDTHTLNELLKQAQVLLGASDAPTPKMVPKVEVSQDDAGNA